MPSIVSATGSGPVRRASGVHQVRAIEPLKKMLGGAQSCLMRCSDDRFYVVKFPNNPQGTRILVNELVCTRLARKLGLSVPYGRIIRVDRELVDEQSLSFSIGTDRVVCQPGPCFGSRYPGNPEQVESTHELEPSQFASHLANLADFAGMFMFDLWTSNIEHRQAVFVRREPNVYYWALMIDFGFCFGGESWTLRFEPLHPLHRIPAAYQWITGIASFEPWLRRLENLSSYEVRSTARDLPDEWFRNDRGELNSLLQELDCRRFEVARMLMGILHAFPKTFPNFKGSAF